MTPTQGGGGNFRVKFMYFFKNLLFYSLALIRQIEYKEKMTKEGSTKIVNFMTSGARSWPNKSYSENALFLLYS